MRRRVALCAALAGLVVASAAGPASAEPVLFSAPVPCLGLCAYTIGSADDACEPEPFGMPFSWDEHVRVVPSDATRMVFTLQPLVDWDAFVCLVEPGPGERALLGVGDRSGVCGSAACGERVEIDAVPHRGRPIAFRAFNWSGGTTCEGDISFV